MYDFIADLDAYFCEKYANYDRLCGLSGYRMPKMQDSEVRADGRTYAYTLPANTMRLANQEKKEELLALLKGLLVDKTFSFSFLPYGFFTKIKNRFSKYAFHKRLEAVLARNSVTKEEAGNQLNVEKEIWDGICKGNFAPTKNLLFSLALTSHFSFEDTEELITYAGCEFDYTMEKDVVISYLLHQKVYNREMVDKALAEYKITNLYIK